MADVPQVSHATHGVEPAPPRVLQQVRDALVRRNYSIRTEQAYIDWIKRFIRFHARRHPSGLGEEHVEAFLTRRARAGTRAGRCRVD